MAEQGSHKPRVGGSSPPAATIQCSCILGREPAVFDELCLIRATRYLGEKTVKVHRARVMEKVRAGSLAERVRLADEAGVTVPKT